MKLINWIFPALRITPTARLTHHVLLIVWPHWKHARLGNVCGSCDDQTIALRMTQPHPNHSLARLLRSREEQIRPWFTFSHHRARCVVAPWEASGHLGFSKGPWNLVLLVTAYIWWGKQSPGGLVSPGTELSEKAGGVGGRSSNKWFSKDNEVMKYHNPQSWTGVIPRMKYSPCSFPFLSHETHVYTMRGMSFWVNEQIFHSMVTWLILQKRKKHHMLLSSLIGPTEITSQVIPAPHPLHILRPALTFFQNSLPRGRGEGPPFCLAPSFAVSVGVGFLAAPWVSWGTKVALSDFRSADVAGDFSAPYRVFKQNWKWSPDLKSERSLFYKHGLGLCMLIFFILFQICYYECGFVLKFWKKSRDFPFGQKYLWNCYWSCLCK